MKAVICRSPGLLENVDIPGPGRPAPGWARLKVVNVGICGTDYHIFEGQHPFLNYPRIMGHEISATVEEVGDGVALTPGANVIVNPYLSCGTCIACRHGKPNCCVRISVLGVHADGAFCEEIAVPADNLYPIGDLSLEAASTVEFLAIGAHAVRRSQALPGSRSLVIGAGPIGLGVALFSRVAGHYVSLLDTSAERLAQAVGLGFHSSIIAGADALASAAAVTGGDGFDVVFDATGNASSMQQALAFVAHGGTLVYVSVVKDDISFSDPEFHKREATIVGSRNATRQDFQHVVTTIQSGGIPIDALVTHRTTLDRLATDLPVWAVNKTGLIKAVVAISGI
jgi:2-desacetyl-2-hydroxyethyl bacteriochlorophyllide A dehydrogenase